MDEQKVNRRLDFGTSEWFRDAFMTQSERSKCLYTTEELQEAEARARSEVTVYDTSYGLISPHIQHDRFMEAVAKHLYILVSAHNKGVDLFDRYLQHEDKHPEVVDEKKTSATVSQGANTITVTETYTVEWITCSACNEPAGHRKTDSTVLCGNKHGMCLNCIAQAKNVRCFVCNDIYLYIDHTLRNRIKDIIHKCPYRGCGFGTFDDIKEHQDECIFKPTKCQWCENDVPQFDKDTHQQQCAGVYTITAQFPYVNLGFITVVIERNPLYKLFVYPINDNHSLLIESKDGEYHMRITGDGEYTMETITEQTEQSIKLTRVMIPTTDTIVVDISKLGVSCIYDHNRCEISPGHISPHWYFEDDEWVRITFESLPKYGVSKTNVAKMIMPYGNVVDIILSDYIIMTKFKRINNTP